jgi:hypothetical protein
MVHRFANIVLGCSLGSAVALSLLLSSPAQAQLRVCGNVLYPECSKSPNAPKSGSSIWSPPTVGGGIGRSHDHRVSTR